MNRLLDILFIALTKYCASRIPKRNQRDSKGHGILALPYYPEDWSGSKERIADWKEYFEGEGIRFDVEWSISQEEYFQFRESTGRARYKFLFRIFKRRFQSLKKIHEYETIWIQRALISYYPYKKSYLETALTKLHESVYFDYYDADYVHTPALTKDIVKNASGITVSTEYLRTKFVDENNNTLHLPMTLNPKNFEFDKSPSGKFIIGWMGSSGNLKHLLEIEKELISILNQSSEVELQIVCPIRQGFDHENVQWIDPDSGAFNKLQWLASIDLGFAPYFGQSETNLAKSPMKILEFLMSDIPVLCTSNVNYPSYTHGENILLIDGKDQLEEAFNSALSDKVRLKEIGIKGKKTALENYSYDVHFEKLRQFLLTSTH